MSFPYLGFGLGLRDCYYSEIKETMPPIDWFEIISENYMIEGGAPLHHLDDIRAHYPIVMHGVSMSLGGTDPLREDYLRDLKKLINRIEPKWISDHLCWTGVHGYQAYDLMPLPFTEETVNHVVQRIQQVQEMLGRQILIENVSSYIQFDEDEMTEWEFLTAICERSDCYLLFDINNIYVSAFNHGFDAHDYLYGVPKNRVQQMHLAGHTDMQTHKIDTHDHPICEGVWSLYQDAVKHFGCVSTMIERDDRYPPFTELLDELNKARAIARQVQHEVSEDVA